MVIGVGNNSLSHRFCKIINKKKLIEDFRFSTNDKRSQNYHEFKPILTKWTKEKTSRKIADLLIEAGVPIAEVNTMDKIIEDPNINLWDMIIETEYSKAGKVEIANTPIKLSKSSDQ